MIVQAIWEFDVDDSDFDETFVDINKLCEDLTKAEIAFMLKNGDLTEEDFRYVVREDLFSEFTKEK